MDTTPELFEQESDDIWDYLDSSSFRSQFTSEESPSKIRFYIEGVRCSKCLAKIESARNQYPDILNTSMDMSRNILTVESSPEGRVAPFIGKLSDLGFVPHPIQTKKDHSEVQKKENRSMLLKMGIAAFCTGNLMTFSTSLYAGVSGSIGRYFEWISFLFFLPILVFSAKPFYTSLWASLKEKKPSVDLPIVGAVLIGFFLSTYHLIIHNGDIYFDSLAVLVLLLLASRYFLKRIQQSFMSSSFFLPFLNQDKVNLWNPKTNSSIPIPLESLVVDQLIALYKGQKLPADGILTSNGLTNSQVYLNNALLTGESLPVKTAVGEMVFAGSELESDFAVISVTATGQETRLGSLFEKMEEEILHRTPLISLTDRLAQNFTYLILTVGLLFFALYSFVDIGEAIRRSLALVILACPCALALATPLTQSLSLLKAAKSGFIIKRAEALERIHQVTSVAFDKTGTLTFGQFKFVDWILRSPSQLEKQIVLSLEHNSKHPIAKALKNELIGVAPIKELVSNAEEKLGLGVSGQFDGNLFELKSLSHSNVAQNDPAHTAIGLYKNGELQLGVSLGDRLRPESKKIVSLLAKLKIQPFLVSGDSRETVQSVGQNLGLKSNQIFGEASPEAKLKFVKKNHKTMMVGDGANDAAALAASFVGVAVKGSMEASLSAADVYLGNSGVQPIADLVLLSRDTMKVIKRNLVFSLIYNVAGATAALLGFVNPLVAAVLMPISSFCVLSSSLYGTSFLRSLSKKQFEEEA